MDGEKNVQTQPSAVSETGEKATTSAPVTTPTTPAPETLTRAELDRILAEREDKWQRQMQSAKDKAVAEVRREADRKLRLAEIERKGLEQGLGNLDEVTRQEVELSRYRTRDAYQKQQEQEEEMAKQEEAVVNDFYDSTQAYLSEVGIDHNDKRIEWGDRTENLATKHKRIMSQVGKIHKETLQKERDSAKQWAKEETAKMRKELGLDSVDTSVATGTGEFAGIPTKASELGKWIGKMSQQDYETKYADKIKEMRRRGLIT